VSFDVIKQTVEDTQRHLRESEEAAWRAAFRPHGVIVTALLRVDFDLSSASDTFLAQALDGLRQMLGFSIGVPLQRDRHCLT
jgi:hypothetical protein